MKKKRVSSVDLTWMIFERMRTEVGIYQRPVSIAVIPDDEMGWRAVVGTRSRKLLTSAAMNRLRKIERELRASFTLAGD